MQCKLLIVASWLWDPRRYLAYFVLVALKGKGKWDSVSKGRWTHPLRDLGLWRYMAKYFPARLKKTTDLKPEKNYVFVMQVSVLSAMQQNHDPVLIVHDPLTAYPYILRNCLTACAASLDG
jgi:hypothetical protein